MRPDGAAGADGRDVTARQRFRSWLARRFRDGADRASDPSGLIPAEPRESTNLLLALVLAGAFALLLGSEITRFPVPAGGDPGEWVASSYPYVGLPYPSWIVPGQYPPLTFPVLGVFVRMAGPLYGARLFLGVAAVLVGLSIYLLARSLLRWPFLALAVEGIVLFNPAFLELFFFGAYPNLLGLVFFDVALAFLVRFARSGRSRHLILFWAALGAALLTHSLVGLLLTGSALLCLLGLFLTAELPRAFIRPKWGGVAAVGALAPVAAFYGVTALLGISHPSYLTTGNFQLARDSIGEIPYLLLHPFLPSIRPDVGASLLLLAGTIGGVALALIALALARRRPSVGSLALASMLVAVSGSALLGWAVSVVTDYARFGYVLVLPLALAIAWVVEAGIGVLRRRTPSSPPGPTVRRRHRPGRLAAAGTAVALVLVVVLAGGYGAPAMATAEIANTRVGHDAAFLQAIQAIQASGVRGAVLTIPGAAKWTRALLSENAYSPMLPGSFSFDASHTLAEELAYFASTSRYTIDAGGLAATVGGFNRTVSADSPVFEAAYYGSFAPIVALPSSGIELGIANGSTLETQPLGAPFEVVPGAVASADRLDLYYRVTGAEVTLEIDAPNSTANTLELSVRATPTNGYQLRFLNASLENPTLGLSHLAPGPRAGSVEVVPDLWNGALDSMAVVEPAASLVGIRSYNGPGAPAAAMISVAGTTPGSPTGGLAFSVQLSTPNATNPIADLPRLVSTSAQWGAWGARFFLYAPSPGVDPLPADEVQYLIDEYSAQVLSVEGEWTVLLLPPVG